MDKSQVGANLSVIITFTGEVCMGHDSLHIIIYSFIIFVINAIIFQPISKI